MQFYLGFYEIEHDGDLQEVGHDINSSGGTVLQSEINCQLPRPEGRSL